MHLNQLQSALLYIVVIAFVYLFAKVAKRRDKVLPLLFAILILSLLVGLRNSTVGIDTKQYVYLFDSGYYTWLNDIGFIELTRLLSAFVDSSGYLFIISFLTCMFFGLGAWRLRHDTDLPMLMLFLTVSILFPMMNTMRQYLSLSVVFFVYKDLLEAKYLKYSVAVVVAASLHVSSIIALALVFFASIIDWKNISAKKKIVVISFYLILPVGAIYAYTRYFGSLIQDKINLYFSSLSVISGLFGVLQIIVVCLVAYKARRNFKKVVQKIDIISMIAVVGVFGNLLGYYYAFMNRVFIPFMFMVYILLATQWMRKSNSNNSGRLSIKVSLPELASLLIILYPFIAVLIGDGYQVMNYSMLM